MNAGDSAGGHLSAVLSLRWRHILEKQANSTPSADEERLHPLKLQVLIYPPTQLLNLSTTSYLLNRASPFLTKENCARNRVWYVYCLLL